MPVSSTGQPQPQTSVSVARVHTGISAGLGTASPCLPSHHGHVGPERRAQRRVADVVTAAPLNTGSSRLQGALSPAQRWGRGKRPRIGHASTSLPLLPLLRSVTLVRGFSKGKRSSHRTMSRPYCPCGWRTPSPPSLPLTILGSLLKHGKWRASRRSIRCPHELPQQGMPSVPTTQSLPSRT